MNALRIIILLLVVLAASAPRAKSQVHSREAFWQHVNLVDAIERNHCIDGAHVWLEQFIFWDTRPEWRVVEWCYEGGNSAVPIAAGDLYVIGFEKHGKHYIVAAPIYFETLTYEDRELADRKQHPMKHRRALSAWR